MKKQLIIADIASSILLLLFFYTSVHKLMEPGSFKLALSMLPAVQQFAPGIAWALPVTELITCILLFFSSTRLKGLYVSFFLLNIFTAYLVYMLLLTTSRPCSCAGALSRLSWTQHIFFNIFLILVALVGILLYKKHKGTRGPVPP